VSELVGQGCEESTGFVAAFDASLIEAGACKPTAPPKEARHQALEKVIDWMKTIRPQASVRTARRRVLA